MSIRDVELLRRWFAAYDRGDVVGAMELVDEYFCLVEPAARDETRYSGRRGPERWMRDRALRPEGPPGPDHFLEADGRVVVVCRQWINERPGGVLRERRFALACSIEHAQIAELEYFPRWEDAFGDGGPSAQRRA
jgi:ketosteroid isomerase-like protein